MIRHDRRLSCLSYFSTPMNLVIDILTVAGFAATGLWLEGVGDRETGLLGRLLTAEGFTWLGVFYVIFRGVFS